MRNLNNISLQAGDVLHLWFREKDPQLSSGVNIYRDSGEPCCTLRSGITNDPKFHCWIASVNGLHNVVWDSCNCEMSVVYTYRPDTVTTLGIKVLWISEEAKHNHIDERSQNKSMGFPQQLVGGLGYHFQSPFGWMNDPNGLCQIGDTIHMFYQHYPHKQRWGSMHWGHAISKDMLHWIHQPVFLFPDERHTRGKEIGGVFSGSALPLSDGQGLRVFYTDRANDRIPEWEWQMTSVSTDCVVAGPSIPIIDALPKDFGLQRDFRDPYVFKGPDGELKMLLGSRTNTASTVLLYTTSDLTGAGGWRFQRVLHEDVRYGSCPAECPCMIELNVEEGLWVLIYGILKSLDPRTGRRNLTTAIVGHFDGTYFEPVVTQELDIGTDCYAFQAYSSPKGPRGLAWAANWLDYHKIRKTGQKFPTVMTLPRELLWCDGALLTPPIPETQTLRQTMLVDTTDSLIKGIVLEDGMAEIHLHCVPRASLENPQPLAFKIDFEHPDLMLTLGYDGNELGLNYNRIVDQDRAEQPRYAISPVALSSLQIFIDVGLIEVFANNGRWCITKRLPSSHPIRSIRLLTDFPNSIEVCVWRLGLT